MAPRAALNWRSRLSEAEAADVLALLDAATEADGRSPVSEAALLRVSAGGEARGEDGSGEAGEGGEDTGKGGVLHLLARAGATEAPNTGDRTGEHAGDHLVAYAQLVAEDSAGDSAEDGTGDSTGDGTEGFTVELAVGPGYRGHGVGGALVRALLDRAEGRTLRVWAHGEHPAATRLAQRYGFTVARSLWRMGRSLLEPPLDEPTWPDGVQLRPFRVGLDEAAFVEVNNRAFAWHPEQGGWNVEQVRAREALPWFDPAGFLLAVDGATDRILGFHWTKAHSAELGEVYVLGVDPAEHGRGLGAALTLAGLHHLRDRGMSTVMLYVEGDNAPAIGTYDKLGFTHWDTDVVYSSH